MIKVDLETMLDFGAGTRNVASAKSNGNRGSILCTIKYGVMIGTLCSMDLALFCSPSYLIVTHDNLITR